MKRMEYDVAIIGSGIAGLTAALHLADRGKRVVVLNRAFEPDESNTKRAEGGIVWRGIDDSPDLLMQDIDSAGDGLGRLRAIEVLAEEGDPLVESFLIDRLSVPFDKDALGHIELVLEAAHSQKRIIHVGLVTGAAIETALVREALSHANITFLTGYTAVDLLSSSHHTRQGRGESEVEILGVYALCRESGIVKTITAHYTIMATGGAGALYRYSTNPDGARGDGIAIAYRAGAHLADMEYIQFHPTAFRKEGCEAFLISEAVRGKGAVLVDVPGGRRFLKDYVPERMELSPRDEVARAIHSEMAKRNLANVYLDLSPIAAKGIDLEVYYPELFARCLASGVDIRREPIPVAPAAHFLCGGINVDEWGRTSLARLYAVGEVSRTGLHGANRLASVSLLEGLVWGKRSAENICGTFARERFSEWDIPDWDESNVEYDTHEDLAPLYRELREIMWRYAGIVRSKHGLLDAREALWALSSKIERMYVLTKLTDELIGFRNAITAALLIVRHALRNKGSRGCHYRSDANFFQERKRLAEKFSVPSAPRDPNKERRNS